MSNLETVTDETFEAEVLGASMPVIVDFRATWCVPCKTIAPVLEKLADRYEGRVRVVKVEAESSPATAARFDVRSVPTVVALRGGEEVERLTGVRSISSFEAMAEKLLSGASS